MRRLIALTATAAAALSLAPLGEAAAQSPEQQQFEETLTVTVSAPGTVTTSGNVAVAATIKIADANPDWIKSYEVWLTNASGQEMGRFCAKTYLDPAPGGPDAVRKVDLSFTWNSKRVPAADGAENCEGGANAVLPGGGSLSTNNTYRVKVIARSAGVGGAAPVDEDTVLSGAVSVNNAPGAPSNVALSRNNGDKTNKITWSKNVEPDVLDYRVQECVVDKSSKPCEATSWKTKADVRGTALEVKAEDPGIYRYRVAALRPTATGGTMVSDAASANGDPTQIEIVAEIVTTTTEPPPPTTPITVTKTVVKPTRRVQRAAPEVVQRIVEQEPGYNTDLPYSEAGESEEVASGLSEGEGSDSQRAVLIPVAFGTLFLMFAMQVKYLTGRISPALETVPTDEDW